MSSHARRTDANHAAIRDFLRTVPGVEVLDLHALPAALDFLVGFRGRLILLELKDGSKSHSRRAVTKEERATIERFRAIGCPVFVVKSEDEALQAIGAIE